MTKICPNCQIEFSDDHGFCSQCGSKLAPKPETSPSTLHLGDANAISGGISINQSKTVQHHDVYYQTTQERAKTDKEIQQECQSKYMEAVKQLAKNGVMHPDDRAELNSLRLSLGIDPETAKKIEDVVINELKAKAKVANDGLNALAKIALKNAVTAIEQNSPQAKTHVNKLEAVCKNTINEQVHFYYDMLMAAFEPQRCVDTYLKRTTDSYWLAFWTSLSYRKLGKETEADALLNEMPVLWPDRPEVNVLLNACVGLMNEGNEDPGVTKAQVVELLSQSEEEPSELLNDLFHALLHCAGIEDEAHPHFSFYEEQFLLANKIAKEKETQAWAERERKEREAKEERERKEREAKEERERKEREAQAQAERQKKAHEPIPRTPNPMSKPMSAIDKREMGDKYYDGKVMPQDYNEAAKWYRMAAEEGDAQSQNKLGYMLKEGKGVTQNYEEAFRWFSKAADQGYVGSMYWKGVLLESGKGVARNYAEAAKWYRKAADQGHAEAQDNLGQLYELGRGVPQSYQEAQKWYKLAADNHSPSGKRHLELIASRVTPPSSIAAKVQDKQPSQQPQQPAKMHPDVFVEKKWVTQDDDHSITVHFSFHVFAMKFQEFSIRSYVCLANVSPGKVVAGKEVGRKFDTVTSDKDHAFWDDWKWTLKVEDIKAILDNGQHDLLAQINFFFRNSGKDGRAFGTDLFQFKIELKRGLFGGSKLVLIK